MLGFVLGNGRVKGLLFCAAAYLRKGGITMSWEHNEREAESSFLPVQAMSAAAAEHKVADWGETSGSGAVKPHLAVYSPAQRKKKGSRIHLVSFAASVLLTLLAFGAALYGEMSADLLVPFLMLMAAIQLGMQLINWMSMKDRNDFYSIANLAFGSIMTLVAVGAAVYWVWI